MAKVLGADDGVAFSGLVEVVRRQGEEDGAGWGCTAAAKACINAAGTSVYAGLLLDEGQRVVERRQEHPR